MQLNGDQQERTVSGEILGKGFIVISTSFMLFPMIYLPFMKVRLVVSDLAFEKKIDSGSYLKPKLALLGRL